MKKNRISKPIMFFCFIRGGIFIPLLYFILPMVIFMTTMTS